MKRFEGTTNTLQSSLENDLPADITRRSLDSQIAAADQSSFCLYEIPDMTPDGLWYRWTYPLATAKNCSKHGCEHVSVIEDASFLQVSPYCSAESLNNGEIDINNKQTMMLFSRIYDEEDNIPEQVKFSPVSPLKRVWTETDSDVSLDYDKDIRTLNRRTCWFISCCLNASCLQKSSSSGTDSFGNEETDTDSDQTLIPLIRSYCEEENIPGQINCAYVSPWAGKTAFAEIDTDSDMDDDNGVRRLKKKRGLSCLLQLFTCCLPKNCQT